MNCRHYLLATVIGIALLLMCANHSSLWTAPLTKGLSKCQLTLVGELKLKDVSVLNAAVLSDTEVVLVGTQQSEEIIPPIDQFEARGAFLDLTTKKIRSFDNGHKASIFSLSVSGTRIATASNDRDPILRVWDTKANKTVQEVKFADFVEEPNSRFGVAYFHKDSRMAVAVNDSVWVFDPLNPKDKIEYKVPDNDFYISEDIYVSPDDQYLFTLCGKHLLWWDTATRAAHSLSIEPRVEGLDTEWTIGGLCFGPKGRILAWRTTNDGEVPDKKKEADVPAELRGIVEIDLAKKTFKPLSMGLPMYTLACAIDPTGTWLIVGGNSPNDNKADKENLMVAELRVYHLPTATLAHREQHNTFPFSWVGFTPSGKRLIATSCDGVVRWWNIETK